MRYSNILVPLDGSRLSEGILPYARSVANALMIQIKLLQVIDPDTIESSSNPQVGRTFDIVEADMKRNCSDYLNEKASSLPGSLTFNRSVEIGNPAEIIADRAAAHAGTLIAMSTHGRSGIQRWLLGSVADMVLHACTNPLLLVRPTGEGRTGEEAPLKTVLVPLDGSSLAELVLPHAAVMAKEMKLEVILLRVYSLLSYTYKAEGLAPDFDQLTKSIRNEVKSYLEEKIRQLKAEGLEKVSYQLLEGDPVAKIIDIAQKTPDNLVAICTHGKSGIGGWALGNVTDRVVRYSGDPVLVIRASPCYTGLRDISHNIVN